MECNENKAIYIIKEKDINCCQSCFSMLYESCITVPYIDRISILEFINDAKKLIFCLKPIASMLKLKFIDEPDFNSHMDSLKFKVHKLHKRLSKATPTKILKINKKVDKMIQGIYENHFTKQITKRLLLSQSNELSKFYDYDQIEYKDTELYQIKNNQIISDDLFNTESQKPTLEFQRLKKENEVNIETINRNHKLDVEKYIDEIDSFKQQIEELNSTITNLKSKKQEIEESYQRLKVKKKSLRKELKSQTQTIQELSQKLEEFNTESTQATSESEMANSKMEQEIDTEFDDRYFKYYSITLLYKNRL